VKAEMPPQLQQSVYGVALQQSTLSSYIQVALTLLQVQPSQYME
jgi:hypothetical protein